MNTQKFFRLVVLSALLAITSLANSQAVSAGDLSPGPRRVSKSGFQTSGDLSPGPRGASTLGESSPGPR
jgi:hypothetical protein